MNGNADNNGYNIANDTKMMIRYDGNVGIGTTSPNAKLHVESAQGGKVLIAGLGAYGSISLNGTVADWNILSASFDKNLYLNRPTNNDIYFRMGDVYQMALKANGRLGVGTNDPEAKLTVTGSSVGNWDPQNNIGNFSGNGLRINSTGNAYSQDAITYQSGLNGGGAAIAFGRGGSWNTFMSFYTNDNYTSGTGSIRERMRLDENGNLGIGTTNPGNYKLAVNGNAIFTKVQVKAASTPFPDYVFQSDYKLRSLEELESYIKEYSHLPEVPSAEEVKKDGLDVAETQAVLLKKIEELTLYVIDQRKKNEKLETQNEVLQQRLEKLEKGVAH